MPNRRTKTPHNAGRRRKKPLLRPSVETVEGRQLARLIGGFAVHDVFELASAVHTAGCSANRIIRGSSDSTVADAMATAVRDVLFVMARAMSSDDPTLAALHAIALKTLAAGPLEADLYGARFRLPKGGKANLRAAAIELAGIVGPGKLDPTGHNTKTLALLAGQLRDGRRLPERITPEELCAAFPDGWGSDVEQNAQTLLEIALGGKKAARNAMQAAADQRAKRAARRPV